MTITPREHSMRVSMQQPNRVFAKQDEVFVNACALAGIPATKRQASKYRNGQGLAYRFHHKAAKAVAEYYSGSNGGAV